MIIYDPHIPVSLTEFGIQIPVRDSRAVNTLEALHQDPRLKAVKNRWHQDRIIETLDREDLERVHSRAYVQRLYSYHLEREIIRTYELIDARGNYHRYMPDLAKRPLTDLFQRILVKTAGTVQAARLAQERGFCFYFAGGMHHAHRHFGSGFCLINDIVIAARKLQAERRVSDIWIIDVDAHKGDGTAALTAGDDTIRTLSIHMARGWPLDGPSLLDDGTPIPSFTPSDIDIPIETGEEAHYIGRLREGLLELEALEAADLAIVVCGADPYEKDELPSTAGLRLSLEQMLARDQLIYSFLDQCGVPAAFLMAGGYGEETWRVYTQFLRWALALRNL
jgi:acetoin utilization deacetylase AcuC-like enzyme